MNRLVLPGLGLAALVASALPAQNPTVRWNDVVASLDQDPADPPTVRVWLDQHMYSWGAPVRVGFRVDEDAFVIVGRVDYNGSLTVLYPSGKRRVTQVRGNEDQYIRSSRMGNGATFVAGERPGSTGYVFAIASREPLDLSRLSQRDFSAWVTGVSIGQPTSRYIGDPYRVLQRFARVVLYNPLAEWDYDVEFYSVDQPAFFTSATNSFSSYCNRFSSYSMYGAYALSTGYDYRRSVYGFDDGYGIDRGYMCNSLQYLSCYNPYYGYGFMIPVFCAGPIRRYGQVALGPQQPPRPTDDQPDSTKTVNPWAPDSVGRPNVDKGTGNGAPNGPHIMTVDPQRPTPVSQGWRASDDLSFSIPSRAMRGVRERREEIGRSPETSGGSGPMPMPSRPIPEVGSQPIEWVRPPRSLDPVVRTDIDRMPSRGSIRRDQSNSSQPDRGIREWNAPIRSSSPIFDREPNRLPTLQPSTRNYDGYRGYSPPPSIDHRPSSPSGMEHRPMSVPSAATAAPPPPPAAKPIEQPPPPPDKKPEGKQPG